MTIGASSEDPQCVSCHAAKSVCFCASALPQMIRSGVSPSRLIVWRISPNVAESVIRDMVGPDWKQRWLNWKNRTPEQVSVSLRWGVGGLLLTGLTVRLNTPLLSIF